MKKVWNIVHDCDAEDGTPTVWSLKISDGKYYWINEAPNGTFEVVGPDAETVLKQCKSLTSAKRWVEMHLL